MLLMDRSKNSLRINGVNHKIQDDEHQFCQSLKIHFTQKVIFFPRTTVLLGSLVKKLTELYA